MKHSKRTTACAAAALLLGSTYALGKGEDEIAKAPAGMA